MAVVIGETSTPMTTTPTFARWFAVATTEWLCDPIAMRLTASPRITAWPEVVAATVSRDRSTPTTVICLLTPV